MDEGGQARVDGRVVAFSDVHLRSRPTTTSPLVAVLKPGELVRVACQAPAEMVADTRQGASLFWLQVRTAGGDEGWVSRLFVDLPYPGLAVTLGRSTLSGDHDLVHNAPEWDNAPHA